MTSRAPPFLTLIFDEESLYDVGGLFFGRNCQCKRVADLIQNCIFLFSIVAKNSSDFLKI